MMKQIRCLLLASAMAVLAPAAAVSSSDAIGRVALVIGNAAYAHATRLANPLNDAGDVGAALGRLGFSVTLLENADYDALRQGLRAFTRSATTAKIAVVFYAGHGIEVDRRNFLIPVDARLESDRDVEFETVPLDLVSRAVERASGLGLVILDACRSNPFAASMQRTGATRSIGRGLARIEPSGETLVAYAAKEGTVAADGFDRNSPYTAALLEHIEEPGLEIGLMFRKVRDSVLAETGGAQEPFTYGSLSSEGIWLAGSPDSTLAGTVAAASGTGTQSNVAAEEMAAERVFWESVKDSDDPADLEAYLTSYPGGRYELLAINRLKRLKQAKTQPRFAPGGRFNDCADCPEMVVIPGGTFMQGSPPSEGGRANDEGPQRQVSVQSFALGLTEVTFAQWDACVSSGVCSHQPDDLGWGRSSLPVLNVSWEDAKEYVSWLNGRVEGSPYRLPSESEWEYAARAGTRSSRHWGNGESGQCAHANGADQAAKRFYSDREWEWGVASCNDGHAQTSPVGSFSANRFGLFDMQGNVWELVEDCWNDSYSGAPRDGTAWRSGDCSQSVVRGGAWAFGPDVLRAANRGRNGRVGRSVVIGFRVARALPGQ